MGKNKNTGKVHYIKVQEDKSKLLNGMDSGEADALKCDVGGFVGYVSGKQRYEYAPNPDGAIDKFTLRNNGQYVRVGESKTGTRLIVGGRESYHDFNF